MWGQIRVIKHQPRKTMSQPILEIMEEVLNDERMQYASASIQINAPLALIQMSKEATLHTCQRILGLPLSQIPLTKAGIAAARMNMSEVEGMKIEISH